MAPEPFRIDVPDAALDDLRRRVRDTRWPDQLPGSGWGYGTDASVLRPLAAYWADGYDWRAHEAALNAFPQLLTTVDGQQVHVIHARSPEPGALPLVLTHGWPGSVAEFAKLVGPLRDPAAHGGDPADAFHVVVPSLPGYGFSGPTTASGWSSRRIGGAWAELMTQLGYDRFGAHGGDWGSVVSHFLAEAAPERVVGAHVTLITAPRPGSADDFADMTERELRMRARIDDHKATGRGYQAIQSTQPQTLAYALNDSPVGLLSWIVEKFRAWTDNDGDVFDAVSRDELLTNVSIYWFTGTIGSSMRLYAESARAGMALAPVRVPLGVAGFPAEITGARRAWVAAHHNLVHWTEFDRGGHFAALEEPDLLVSDIRDFFRPLRP